MKPIDFKESNSILTRPPALTDLECGSLQVWTDQRQCVSCWEPSLHEMISILIFGKIWLSVHSGTTQPPVWIDGTRTAFTKPSFKETFDSCCDRLFTKKR